VISINRGDKQGQAIIEALFCLLVFFILTAGIFQCAYLLFHRQWANYQAFLECRNRALNPSENSPEEVTVIVRDDIGFGFERRGRCTILK